MDTDRYQIDDERREAGYHILEMLDKVGFDAYAAAWLHDIPTQSWKYMVSTPMLYTKGPGWVYERLIQLFRHTPLPSGISPLDILVLDTTLEITLFGKLFINSVHRNKKDIDLDPRYTALIQSVNIENWMISDGFAWFYRRIELKLRKGRENPSIKFDNKIKMLQAA